MTFCLEHRECDHVCRRLVFDVVYQEISVIPHIVRVKDLRSTMLLRKESWFNTSFASPDALTYVEMHIPDFIVVPIDGCRVERGLD